MGGHNWDTSTSNALGHNNYLCEAYAQCWRWLLIQVYVDVQHNMFLNLVISFRSRSFARQSWVQEYEYVTEIPQPSVVR